MDSQVFGIKAHVDFGLSKQFVRIHLTTNFAEAICPAPTHRKTYTPDVKSARES